MGLWMVLWEENKDRRAEEWGERMWAVGCRQEKWNGNYWNPKGEERKEGAENTCKGIMAENVQNLGRDLDIRVHEAHGLWMEVKFWFSNCSSEEKTNTNSNLHSEKMGKVNCQSGIHTALKQQNAWTEYSMLEQDEKEYYDSNIKMGVIKKSLENNRGKMFTVEENTRNRTESNVSRSVHRKLY